LTDKVWLGDAGDAWTMVHEGATVLVDLRGEATPPALPVPIEHFPLQDMVYGQHAVVRAAARRLKALVDEGHTVGVYCQAGVSRTAAVAIAYLMLDGLSLTEATRRLRQARPQALPAVGLMQILSDLEHEGGVDPWTHVEVTVDGLTVHGVHQPGTGPTVVLFHGAYGSWTHWVRNLKDLAAVADVYALDLPGFGESGDMAGSFGWPAYLDLLHRVVTPMRRGPLVVGGYSFGASVAARLVAAYPDVADALLLVSLVGRVGDPATHHPVEERHFVAHATLEDRLAVIRHNLQHWHLGTDVVDEPTVRMTYLNVLRTRLTPRRLRTDPPPPSTLDVLARLPRVPTLFVWGERDAFCQPTVDVWRAACLQALPQAETAVLAGAAHWCQYADPGGFAKVAGPFVSRLASAGAGSATEAAGPSGRARRKTGG
jgi:pimeloyl-ACP methyl ester carboxylesterase/protein-tyrosine phosphatase